MTLRAPFPWFGGKSRVAELVWERFGNVDSYNEPFAGSLAVLLGRPDEPRLETVNDLDCYIANFWRALKHDPEAGAYHADAPVNEADLHARHRWLVSRGRRLALRVRRDPHYFNVKVAGWWVWGQCLWIGSGWCQAVATGRRTEQALKRPKLRERGTDGVAFEQSVSRHANGAASDLIVDWQIRPDLSAANGRGGVMVSQRSAATRSFENPSEQRKRPHLTDDRGVNSLGTAAQNRRPHLLRDKGVAARRWQGGGAGGGSGVHAPSLAIGSGDAFDLRTEGLYTYLYQLAARLRRVRVCCGDWQRILTRSVTTYIGVTGVFLDPPYRQDLRERCYAEDHDISADVRAWAIANGANPDFRIALCGYAGEHDLPTGWEEVAWKAHGGYSRTERGRENRSRERIWFSPHCLKPEDKLPLDIELLVEAP